MKKQAYLLIFLLPIYFLLSYSSGAPYGYTGSPGDNNNSCVQCHSYSGSGYNPDFVVTGIPANGYMPGQTYQLTLTVNNVNTPKFGFEACIEDDTHQKQGAFASVDNKTQAIQSNTYITHTSSGNTVTQWIFDWTAPASSQGDLNLYFAVNMANANGSTSGDYIENSQVSIPLSTSGAVDELVSNEITFYPNPATNFLQLQTTPYKFHQAIIQDVLGKTYTIPLKNNHIDISFLPAGIYFLKLQNEKVKAIKQFIKQ